MRIGMSFMNGIGNFIFFTSAVKILKNWGYDDIVLHTHEKFLSNPAMMEVADGIFTEIKTTEPDLSEYDKFFACGWSQPTYMRQYWTGWNERNWKTNDFRFNGMHEVQIYLNMIGASWNDFDGYIFKPIPTVLNSDKFKIALANPDPKRSQQVSYKTWDKMPELSKTLVDLGYEVFLIGTESELDGCMGRDFTGHYSLRESAGVIEDCDLLIAPSTCAAILADAVGTPVLALEGPILGSKTHPLQVPYRNVRHMISCAPCFQQKMMKFCTDNICMTSIEVGDVIRELYEFRKVLDQSHEAVWSINQIQKNDDPEFEECDKTIAYLFPCFERYKILEACLKSFKESNPQKGAVLFLNDASTDSRVQDLIDDFECDGLTKYMYQRDWHEKFEKLTTYMKTPSTHAYNFLLNEILKLEKYGIVYDFISIIDPDAIFKKNWSQYLVNLYEEVTQLDDKIGMLSGFNYENHPIYDDYESKVVYTTNGNKTYRTRKGANLHYMMSFDFFKNVYGLYPLITEKASADVSKAAELAEKGYRTLVAVPSLMQQIGAFGSSFSRLKSDEIAYDF